MQSILEQRNLVKTPEWSSIISRLLEAGGRNMQDTHLIHSLIQTYIESHPDKATEIRYAVIEAIMVAAGRRMETHDRPSTRGIYAAITHFRSESFANSSYELAAEHRARESKAYDVIESLLVTDSKLCLALDEHGISLFMRAAQQHLDSIVELTLRFEANPNQTCQSDVEDGRGMVGEVHDYCVGDDAATLALSRLAKPTLIAKLLTDENIFDLESRAVGKHGEFLVRAKALRPYYIAMRAYYAEKHAKSYAHLKGTPAETTGIIFSFLNPNRSLPNTTPEYTKVKPSIQRYNADADRAAAAYWDKVRYPSPHIQPIDGTITLNGNNIHPRPPVHPIDGTITLNSNNIDGTLNRKRKEDCLNINTHYITRRIRVGL